MAGLEGVQLSLKIGPVVAMPAPPAVIHAFESAQVTQAAGARSSFQLSFRYSKTSPIATTLLPTGFFDPLIRVIIIATLNGTPHVLMDGPIKRIDVSPTTAPGENRLTLTGEDVSGYMDLIDMSGTPFPAMPPFARVAALMAKYMMFGVIPLTIPAIMQGAENPMQKFAHQQGTDFAYATALAKEAGYEFYLTPGPLPGANTAYWGPPVRVGVPQPALSLDMDRAGTVESLSFSTDGAQAELPYGFVKIAGISVPVPVPDIGLLKPPLSARPVIPTKLVKVETERLSEAEVIMRLLAGRAGPDPVSASGTLDIARYGQPLKARGLVGVRGAGLAHDGLYYVKSITHTLGRGSWKQAFQLVRDGLVSNLPRIPT